MKRIMVTGATRGLGLEIARALSERGDVKVVLAVRDIERGMELARSLGANAAAVELDLSSLASVAAFAKSWDSTLDGLVNNAGVQNHRQIRFTQDGFEETIAVNFLASLLLTLGLSERLRGGRVLFIGSGTHDPRHPSATMLGYRGARYSSVPELAKGGSDAASPEQANRDRYATSKFLVTALAAELARRGSDFAPYVIDPGLMPGTGLARDHGAFERLLWKSALPLLAAFLPDTSTARRSGRKAARIMAENEVGFPPGTVLSFDGKPGRYVWKEMVEDPRIGKRILADSIKILDAYLR